jgi:hypothetical protein
MEDPDLNKSMLSLSEARKGLPLCWRSSPAYFGGPFGLPGTASAGKSIALRLGADKFFEFIF